MPLDDSRRGVGGDLIPGRTQYLKSVLECCERVRRGYVATRFLCAGIEGSGGFDELSGALLEVICGVHGDHRSRGLRYGPWGSIPIPGRPEPHSKSRLKPESLGSVVYVLTRNSTSGVELKAHWEVGGGEMHLLAHGSRLRSRPLSGHASAANIPYPSPNRRSGPSSGGASCVPGRCRRRGYLADRAFAWRRLGADRLRRMARRPRLARPYSAKVRSRRRTSRPRPANVSSCSARADGGPSAAAAVFHCRAAAPERPRVGPRRPQRLRDVVRPTCRIGEMHHLDQRIHRL